MTKKNLILISIFTIYGVINSQNYYTQKKYSNTVSKNISYGKDTGFAGELVDLQLDIYKPVKDSNCHRPILVVIHGGAWISGDKGGGAIPSICQEFSKRGYVVASINYRMGFHKLTYYVPYALCIQDKCIYAFDSSEIIRANYRAMQDAKAAIRFMKARFKQDSTDPGNVYLIGESAGAFITYATAYLDNDTEKPQVCGKLGNAGTPDADLAPCLPSNPSYTRPDLGPANGRLNINGMDAKVKGVACFYGGVFEQGIFKNTDAADTPVLYSFHQTCDVVVDNNKNTLLSKLYQYCFNPVNLCQPIATMPPAYGTTAIKKYIDTVSYHKPLHKYVLLTGGGSYSCDVNSNCHGIDNIANRSNEIADFFAPVIKSTGNTPSTNDCYSTTKNHILDQQITLFPNPAKNTVNIKSDHASTNNFFIEIFDINYRLVRYAFSKNSQFDVDCLKNGIYIVRINQTNQWHKLIISNE